MIATREPSTMSTPYPNETAAQGISRVPRNDGAYSFGFDTYGKGSVGW